MKSKWHCSNCGRWHDSDKYFVCPKETMKPKSLVEPKGKSWFVIRSWQDKMKYKTNYLHSQTKKTFFEILFGK